jgi:anaerobic selenocysteine-containing dehydrogenase
LEHAPPVESADDEYPLILITGRVKYHWHTMTRTGKNQALRRSAPDPIVELNRADAGRFNILDGDFERAGSPFIF